METAVAARLPSFLVLGAPKSATTSLHVWLVDHPDVYLPTAKETHFLDQQAGRGLELYRRYFAEAPEGAVVGEVASTYLEDAAAPHLVEAWLPGIKAVALLRDPAARAWSHAWDLKSKMGLDRDAATELRAQMAGRDPAPGFFDILRAGHYAGHIDRWRAVLPERDLLLVLSDEVKADPVDVYDRVCRHVGVDPDRSVPDLRPANVTRPPRSPLVLRAMLRGRAWRRAPRLAPRVDRWNRLDGTPALPHDLRAELVAHYEPGFNRLEEQLGRPLPVAWRR